MWNRFSKSSENTTTCNDTIENSCDNAKTKKPQASLKNSIFYISKNSYETYTTNFFNFGVEFAEMQV